MDPLRAWLDSLVQLGATESTILQSWLSRQNQAPKGPLTSITDAKQRLLDAGIVTAWQLERIDAGGSLLLGRYRLISPLGEGGMGSVYLAEHLLMRRKVAIKVLPESRRDPSFLDRFAGESRAIAALNHPNIVKAYDFNFEDDLYFLVLEHLQGMDLDRWLEHHGQMPIRMAASYIQQAAVGLAHAHAAGVVHCDVKPSNLFLDQTGTIKILDLGLARFEDHPQPSTTDDSGSSVMGTVDFLSPEQAISSTIDPRSDVYSLGCTLYYLLTGRPPFPTGGMPQKLLAHQLRKPEPIANLRPSVPESLLAIQERMTAKRPSERFQSMEEVSAALCEWLLLNDDIEELEPQEITETLELAKESTRIVIGEAPASATLPRTHSVSLHDLLRTHQTRLATADSFLLSKLAAGSIQHSPRALAVATWWLEAREPAEPLSAFLERQSVLRAGADRSIREMSSGKLTFELNATQLYDDTHARLENAVRAAGYVIVSQDRGVAQPGSVKPARGSASGTESVKRWSNSTERVP